MKLAVVAFAVAALATFDLTGELLAQPLPTEYPNVTFFLSGVGEPPALISAGSQVRTNIAKIWQRRSAPAPRPGTLISARRPPVEQQR